MDTIDLFLCSNDWKQERRRKSMYRFRDSPTASENRLIALPEKAKSVPGFETGSHGQNAVALPLVPPPLPLTVAS